MLSSDDLRARATSGEIDTVVAGFTDHHGRLCGKRFAADFFLDHVAAHGTHGCDYLLTTDLEMDPVPGYAFAGWGLGYGDVHLVPDLATLRVGGLAGPQRARALQRPPSDHQGPHRRRPAHDPASAGGPLARGRVLRDGSHRARALPLPDELPGRRAGRARRARAGRLVPRGLPAPARCSHRGLPRCGPPPPSGGRACRWRARRASGASVSTR